MNGMTTTIKTYPKICDHCNGKGQIMDNPNCTNPYITCPVCHGAGTVTVTETTFQSDQSFPHYEPPYKVTCDYQIKS
jgi:DnaJ-class molecular chaperone